MSISSTHNVKLGLYFIKSNFGALWLMTLKVIITALPVLPVFIWGLTEMHLYNRTFAVSLTFLSAGEIILISTVLLLSLVPPLLAFCALSVALTRSIVFEEKLNTAIFSKLFDKTVLKVFLVNTLIVLSFVITIVLIIGFFVFLEAAASKEMDPPMNPINSMTYIFLSIVPSIFAITYLILRFSLIPLGIATGDINSLSGAFSKTKGQLWTVFKILLWVISITLTLNLTGEIPIFLLSTDNMLVRGILLAILLILSVPLYHIGTIALSYVYKKIR